MSYLLPSDYKRFIQADNLSQVIGLDSNVLSGIELAAQAEVVSYLVQKYQVQSEFADLIEWSPANIYYGGQRIYLNAAAYSSATSYVADNLTLYGNNVYICTANTTGTFDPSKWIVLGAQYKLFYVKFPATPYKSSSVYAIGDQVFYGNKVYTSLQQTSYQSQYGQLQSEQKDWRTAYPNPYPINVTPGSGQQALQFWGAGVAYSVAAGTLVTDTTKFTAGDLRSQQLVTYTVDIALYHVHSRIAPNNIPELRVKRYDDAVLWLKMAGRGEITPDLLVIEPRQGNRVRYSTEPKATNSY